MAFAATHGPGRPATASDAVQRRRQIECLLLRRSNGVRVVGLRPLGMPDSGTIEEVYGLHAKAWGISREQFHEKIAGRTHSRRLPALREMANAAASAASDAASAMTGTILNLNMGSLDD